MKLYEYEEAMDAALDAETGEVNEELINGLWEDRDTRLDQAARWTKDTEANIAALKAEIKRLSDRCKVLERAAGGMRAYIARILNGSKFWCTAASISFRRSKAVEIPDEAALVRWALNNGQDQILRIKEPEINKTEVKRLLESDSPIKPPAVMAHIEDRQNLIIK
jgi:hypothetical protein